MMIKDYGITFILIVLSTFSYAQQPKDTIYGNVKKVRENVVFLTTKENPQFLYENDYGHSGFIGPISTISNFREIWFSTEFCYYINYERHFDKEKRIIEDNWFTKDNSLLDSYKFRYDEKGRLIRKIDSSKHFYSTESHYFNSDYHEHIIYENLKYNSFDHLYKKYTKEKKLIQLIKYVSPKVLDEYIYKYNEKGKLKYVVNKSPYSTKKTEKGSLHGILDSIGTTYKKQINTYDTLNRLIKQEKFEFLGQEEIPKLVKTEIYTYKLNNLISVQTINSYGNFYQTFEYFIYDTKDRIIKKYCCDENKSQAKRVEKYFYTNNEITSLEYTNKDFYTGKMKTYLISYKYKYDHKGNWNEVIKTVNGTNLYKWTRKIEYYE